MSTDIQTIRPSEFFKRCEQADWYYTFSDDSSVFRRGKAEEEELKRIAGLHQITGLIYSTWENYRNAVHRGLQPFCPLVTDFNFGDDPELAIGKEVAPVTPVFRTEFLEWDDFIDAAEEACKKNAMPFSVNILEYSDEQLDNYIQRRYGDYAKFLNELKTIPPGQDGSKYIYNGYLRIQNPDHNPVLKYKRRGKDEVTFKSAKQMICWFIATYW